jgi:hypothetical protein
VKNTLFSVNRESGGKYLNPLQIFGTKCSSVAQNSAKFPVNGRIQGGTEYRANVSSRPADRFPVVERIPMDHRLATFLKKWIKQHRMLSAFRELTRKPSRTNNTDRQVRSW